MTLALPAPAAAKFAKIVGLLGSDQPGEVVAAAAAGTRLLRAHGLGWSDLIAPYPAPRPEARQGGDHRTRALRLLARARGLSGWEAQFLQSIARRAAPLTEKQAAVLARLERDRAA